MTTETEVKKEISKELIDLALESVQIKIDLKAIVHGLMDKVLEPALQKVVDDTANPIDNAIKAMIYPTLSAEAKKYLDAEIEKLEVLIATKIAELKAQA